LFTDDREFALLGAKKLSQKIPGKIHAACLGEKIVLFKDGEALTSYGPHTFPSAPPPPGFVPKEYRRDPNAPPKRPENRHYRKREWQQFVLDLLSDDKNVVSCTMMGQRYQQGHNLQAFDTVIHLDRDSWNGEDMRQRTARVWRQGQENVVEEFTLDMTYAHPTDTFDATLDTIREYHQILDSEVFDAIIKGAQKTELGREWYGMLQKRASEFGIEKHLMALMCSPHLSREGEGG
jgi:hypothetical protein